MKKTLMIGSGVLLAVGISGCGTTGSVELQEQLAAKEKENSELSAKVRELESGTMTRAAAPQMMPSKSAMGGGDLLPPKATAGECYARVWVPPTYKTVTKTVLKSDASQRVETMPAVYDMVEEQVLVREASEELKVIPAKYDWVEEKVLVKEASTQLREVPAVYETVEEKTLVRDAHTVWKKGRGPIEKIDNATGEIMCLVEVPAEYRIVRKRVLKSPAGVKETQVPAEYNMVRKRIMVEPPKTAKVEIPAEYKTVKVRKLIKPASERRVEIPAEYQEVTDQVVVSDGHLEWRSILCETNTTPDTVRRLQAALKKAGYDPGPMDGMLGAGTMNAVRAYQRDNGMAEGQVTINTLKKLKVM